MTVAVASPQSVLSDPRWFADGFDPQTGTIVFTEASRDVLTAEPFLDHRWKSGGARKGRMALSTVVAGLAEAPSPRNLRFIWHTGFCCSTLLARALDRPGKNLSLCEPKILVNVADAKRAGGFAIHSDLVALPDVAFGLLSRPFADGEAVTVKPAPAANYLLQDTAKIAARHLLLFSDCESFVTSVVKMGADGTNYVRTMLNLLLQDGVAPEWDPARASTLSLFRLAALVWQLQIAEFRTFGPALYSLDCDALLDNPVDALRAVDDHFALGLGEDHIARTVAGPLFRRNAKNPQASFGPARRREEHAAARKEFGAELRDAVAWGYENFSRTPAGAPLPNPLIPFEKVYA
jgi:hypothetical protein